MNVAAATAEIFVILTNTIVFQHMYRETCLRLTFLQTLSAVNVKIIWSQMYILHFNAFRIIFHLKENLADATVVTYYSLFICLFIYFQPNIFVLLPPD